MKFVMLVALVVIAVIYTALFVWSIRRNRQEKPGDPWLPSPHQYLIGFVTNFFDALGIGSFAPTTVWFRATKMVPDERIPGTLNVGHTLPAMFMGLLFIKNVEVDTTTLISMIGAAVAGAWFGAGFVAKLSRKHVQLGMGMALIVAAFIMGGFQIFGNPAGADALGVEGVQLLFACVGIAILGALMTIGVGLYAPCMVLVSLLGMNPIAAFPIMMGSCAFLMPAASVRFLKEKASDLRTSLGLTLGGLPAVIIAVMVVKSLPLDILKWLVVVVVLVTAVLMLRSGLREDAAAQSSKR